MSVIIDDISRKKRKLQEIERFVNDSYISSIQQTISEILRVTGDPDSSAKDLKDVIEIDPSLASQVIRRANSAYYANSRNIKDIQQAVIWLGFNTLKELALNQKVAELFKKKRPICGYSRIELWKQSVAVALCGKLIYSREYGERGENIYAAGLLHNIGIIIFDQFLHNEFVQVLKSIRKQALNLDIIESRVLGINHAELGKYLINRWNYPKELVMAIGYHHSPNETKPGYLKITKTLYIANFICQKMGFGFVDMPYEDYDLFQKFLEELEIHEKDLEFIIIDVEEQIYQMVAEGWFHF